MWVAMCYYANNDQDTNVDYILSTFRATNMDHSNNYNGLRKGEIKFDLGHKDLK